MTAPNQRDPEPLAYQVCPQAAEGFGSWLGRLAGAHEVGPVELFGYLHIDTALVQFDLERGKQAVPGPLRMAFDEMVRRLAWAVSIDAGRIREMFVKADPNYLLPPALRRFICPVCALEWRRAGQPIIVKREWILRLAWRCHDHRVLLVDLARAGDINPRSCGWLVRVGDAMAASDAAQDYDNALVARNRQLLKHLLGPTPGALSRVNADYLFQFAAPRWHFAASRTLLLASAHADKPALFARYQLFEQQLTALREGDARRPGALVETLPVTLPGLAETIARVHLDFAARGVGRLAALNERLRARPLVLTKAQARLDATFGRLCAAWQRRVRQRALRERRKVLAAECEVMLGRISLERFENCSQIEALRYLQAARDYWRAAQARCQSRWPPKPLARPDDWGLAMPPMGQLERMIAERAQASNARS